MILETGQIILALIKRLMGWVGITSKSRALLNQLLDHLGAKARKKIVKTKLINTESFNAINQEHSWTGNLVFRTWFRNASWRFLVGHCP